MSEIRPLVFMHVPKTAGTSVAAGLEAALAPVTTVRGLDRSLFGSFGNFAAFSSKVLSSIFTSSASLPRNAGLVSGHFSYSTLRFAYPEGRFVTLLREPLTRLLSHWLYWRQIPDEDLAGWGDWRTRVRKARLPLAKFLCDPTITSQFDNVVTRTLLWPNRLIPPDGFIQPRHDRELLREAKARLGTFDFADIIERGCLEQQFSTWLKRPFRLERLNETAPMPPGLRSALHHELTGVSYRRAIECSRLDLQLWNQVASQTLSFSEVRKLREHTIVCAIARYAEMMSC